MKPNINPFLRRSLCCLGLAAIAQGADYTVNPGETLSLSNGSYTAANLLLQGGTVSGSGNYNAYGASIITGVTVSGSAASTITGSSWFNIIPITTFTVADVTGSSATDLLVSTSLRGGAGNPDWTYNAASIIKEGVGTMEITAHSFFWGGLTLNEGTLKVSGGNSGYGFFSGNVTVNSGTTLETVSDGTGLGWNNGWKPASVNINGGMITTAGTSHIWGIVGGINMTAGTLQSNSGVSDANGAQLEWNQTDVNTNASAETAIIGGRIRIREDGGYAGITFNVADGAAITDLNVSAAVTEASTGRSITKTGAGTMELSGASTYTGDTTVAGGKLVVNGNISTSMTTVQNGASLGGVGTTGSVNVLNGGTLAPGNSPGTLTIIGNLGLNDASILDFQLNPSNMTVGGGVNDLVTGVTHVTLDGLLNVTATHGSFAGVTSGSWRLFDYAGTMTDNMLSLNIMPTLDSGYSWSLDTATSGQVNLVIVPEPASALLGGLGLITLWRRRR